MTQTLNMNEVPPPIGGVCFSLPSPSCRGAARGELRSGGGQAKACPASDEALTQQHSASCIASICDFACLWGRLLTCGRLVIGLLAAPRMPAEKSPLFAACSYVGQPILAAAGFQPAFFALQRMPAGKHL
jgi:hypothetical protein